MNILPGYTYTQSKNTRRITTGIHSPFFGLFFLQMISRPEGDEMGIKRRGWNGDGPRTTDIRVTQLVRQSLNLVRSEIIIVPQNVIVGRPTSSLHVNEDKNGRNTIDELEKKWRTECLERDPPTDGKYNWSVAMRMSAGLGRVRLA